MKRDHGKVETFSVLDLASLPSGTGGPSIPEPVVHPLPAAALSANPIAASFERGERERLRFLGIGTPFMSFDADSGSASLSLLLEAREKRRGLEGRNLLGKKMGREEEEEEEVIGEEHEVTRESMGGR